ncbi:ATP-binding protein [Actinoplanes sp. NPDC024001]|uniref:sensor histidine kinase n=1 Tax=Actinoplanes sp. NPDC024001 TaxID=3154598 RepID=UPI0033FBABC5
MSVNPTGRWTTQRWFAVLLVGMAVLIVGGAALGAEALARTTAVSNRLADRISPARTTVVELDAALQEQASGVRGYLLSGQDALLRPYPDGVVAEQAAAARMRRLLAGEPDLLAALADLESQAARWRSVTADPLIDVRRRTGTAPVGTGENDFETVRRQVAALDQRLIAEREEGRAALDSSRRSRDTVFAGLTVLLLAAVASIAVLLRVVVLRPLGELGTAVRRVAAGDFEHRLTPSGPADMAELGQDVEAMRGRLVDALVTSRQAHEELRRSNADLEQFAYVASHDLQEPLRKVASFCQMLQRRYADALDDRAQQYISFAVDGATRMQRLINDLLSFSRIGRVYDGNHPVDLNDVLDQVEQTLANRIEENGARIIRPPLPTVPGDLTLLTMLWQNLLGNAIKFRHPDRPPQVEITASGADGLWTFTVRDNGIGIDPQFAEKIFVIFQRLHPRDQYSGTGIGLAICKRVVEHHGGTIELDPAYTEGAALTFTLPGPTPTAPAPAAASSAAAL